MVSALTSRAKGTVIHPRLRQGNFWCQNTLSFVICKHEMNTVCCTLDWDVHRRPPEHPVQVKEPYGNSKRLLVGLHSATEMYKVHSIGRKKKDRERKRDKERKSY